MVLVVAFVIVVLFLPARATEGLDAHPAVVPDDAPGPPADAVEVGLAEDALT
jgi:hypothetical protein